jgi:hypothetical protein
MRIIRRAAQFGLGFAIIGALLAAVIASRTPVLYVSNATLQLQPPQDFTDLELFRIQLGKFIYVTFSQQNTLGNIVKTEKLYGYDGERSVHSLNGLISKMRLSMKYELINNGGFNGSFRMGFADQDPVRAQRILKELINILTTMPKPGTQLQVLSDPSIPAQPIGLSHIFITILGASIGLVLGVISAWLSLNVRVSWQHKG